MIELAKTGKNLSPSYFEIKNFLAKTAGPMGLDLSTCLAICQVETAFNIYRSRYERCYRWVRKDYEKFAHDLIISAETELVLESISWGPMQIMGATARDAGFTGHLTELASVEKGLYFSLVHLQSLSRKYKGNDLISSWNQGSPEKALGRYLNQEYVDKVLSALGGFR